MMLYRIVRLLRSRQSAVSCTDVFKLRWFTQAVQQFYTFLSDDVHVALLAAVKLAVVEEGNLTVVVRVAAGEIGMPAVLHRSCRVRLYTNMSIQSF
jgi:uncharacterized protein YqiB (DUF1249 family)